MTSSTLLTFTDHIYKVEGGIPISLRVWANPMSSREQPSPILFWTHGGAWMQGARYDIVAWVLENFHARGYTFVSVDYRLLPQATLQDMMEDVQDAYAWVREKINTEMAAGFADVDRIAVGGDSAGGNLATLMGALAMPRPVAVLDLYGIVDLVHRPLLDLIQAAEDFPLSGKFSEDELGAVLAKPGDTETLANCPFPPNQPDYERVAKPPGFEFTDRYWLQTDLKAQLMRTGGIVRVLLGSKPGSADDAETIPAESLSTLSLLDKADSYPPTCVLHGTADIAVEVAQSDHFVQALEEKGVSVLYTRQDGGAHCFDRAWSDKSAPDWEEQINKVVNFIDHHVRA